MLLVLAGVAGCASIGNPSGGPRDEQPPRFLRANPAPGSANVPLKIDRIRLDFDELVTLKDAFSKVVVSPPSTSVPRVTSSGHSVFVNFQDSLLPNTTYTIDFSNAIEDNNENNPLENFSYTFSTGEIVDSLRIAGIVASADALEPQQGKLVGVHRDLGDSAVYVSRFDRVAKTDDRGRFSIEGLAPGQYRVYFLDDTNSDYLYSSPEEAFAFSREIITPYAETTVTSDTIYNLKSEKVDTVVERQRTVYFPNNILLRSFLTSRKQQFVSKYERQDSTRIYMEFNAPQKLPGVGIVGAPTLADWAVIERSAGNDTLTYWIKHPSVISTDTLRLHFDYEKLDSINQYVAISDTLRFTTPKARQAKAAVKKEDKKKKKDDEETTDSVEAPPTRLLAVNFLAIQPKEVYTPLIFETEQPLAALDTANLRLEVMVDTLWQPIGRIWPGATLQLPDTLRPAELQNVKDISKVPSLEQDSLNPRRFMIEYPWAYETQYRLIADSLAMRSIYDISTGPVSQEFKTRAENEYCSITLKITDWPAGLPAFVELLESSDKPLRRAIVENGTAHFPYLRQGKYYFRIVNDLNGNGIMDTGDIMENRLPEETYYYPKAINIKQNWNKEESWEVFAVPVDEMKPSALLKNKPTRRKGETQQRETDEDEEEENLFPSAAERNRQQNYRNGRGMSRTATR